MARGKKVRAELTDQEIDAISKIQRFTYRCIKMFNSEVNESPVDRNNEEKTNLMNRWGSKIFQGSEIKIVFDETVWLPEDSGSHGNVVHIFIKDSPLLFTSIKIDFRKGFHSCVSFVTGETVEDVNIFDVQYTLNKKDE